MEVRRGQDEVEAQKFMKELRESSNNPTLAHLPQSHNKCLFMTASLTTPPQWAAASVISGLSPNPA